MQILKVIKRHGWSVDHIAEKMGVTSGAVSQRINIEQPTWGTMNVISDIIGCSIAEFFEDDVMDLWRERGADMTTIDREGNQRKYIEITEK